MGTEYPAVQVAHEQARDELRRADTKATALLSVVSLGLAGVVALTTRQTSPATMAALWTAAAPILLAVLTLLAAIRPHITQFPTPGTWLDATFNGPAVLLEAQSSAAAHTLAADTANLGHLAVEKFRRITRAVSLLMVGLCLLTVALVLGGLT
ncbi:Pycsar system effector family protein [Amycolatopsis sp. YIM 10]|uniref:Pycsar system effector family protein n=1 Tax=Amycolatopsis sp. YIM 10 TaxID=2653857 RepID=UPI00129000CF|nr:Pycsar system effector family protein [Amycolatopsis sp. YIM 10]QFU85728.1 hypothetical protein YIM_02515 [Amycolatopsis sp. YIM 10]